MTTDLGRPRDPRIDDAVLRATVELLGKSGYADLSVDAIARRAGTSKPAIYRRWPSKAHLVHEAVFPIIRGDRAARHRLAGRRRPRNGASLGGRADHAGRAGGMPGIVAEMATDPTLHAKLLERFGDILARGLTDRLDDAEGARRGPAGRDRRRPGGGHRRHHPDGAHHQESKHSTTPGWSAPPP